MPCPQTFPPTVKSEGLEWSLSQSDLGFSPAFLWNPSPSSDHRITPYPVPQSLRIGIRVNLLTSSKFSPPPMAVVLEGDGRRWFLGVAADAGWHQWNEIVVTATAGGVTVTLDLEGRTAPGLTAAHVRLEIIGFEGKTPLSEVLAQGLAYQYPAEKSGPIPDWWLRPIYCGWGDQVAHAMHQEGIGRERRAMAYCIQGLYDRWIAHIEKAGVPIGTVTIDGGWSLTGVWVPDPIRWPDLRAFIRKEHEAGRKVLLWIGTWLWDGLSEALSILGDGRQWTADPSNPLYLETIARWVTELISPDGFDADGFKIDQLSFSPHRHSPRWCPRFGFREESEETVQEIRQAGTEWGIELLHRYQKTIYDAAKAAKPDALITSSTVHPYFRDTFDMVRLHDMGKVPPDLMQAMKARADLAAAALPGFPIDTDDWVHRDYNMWLDYTSNSHQIGVPCLFYSERFITQWDREPGTIPITHLDEIAKAWEKAGYTRPESARQQKTALRKEMEGYQSE